MPTKPTAPDREDVLSGVEVRTVGRQEAHKHTSGLKQSDGGLVMHTSIVQNQDTPLFSRRPRQGWIISIQMRKQVLKREKQKVNRGWPGGG